jgi:hypothetical protein
MNMTMTMSKPTKSRLVARVYRTHCMPANARWIQVQRAEVNRAGVEEFFRAWGDYASSAADLATKRADIERMAAIVCKTGPLEWAPENTPRKCGHYELCDDCY